MVISVLNAHQCLVHVFSMRFCFQVGCLSVLCILFKLFSMLFNVLLCFSIRFNSFRYLVCAFVVCVSILFDVFPMLFIRLSMICLMLVNGLTKFLFNAFHCLFYAFQCLMLFKAFSMLFNAFSMLFYAFS